MHMRSPLILTLGIALALASSLVAYGALADPNASWDIPLRRLIWKNTSHEVRAKLYIHLPGIFPLPFLCTLTQDDGVKSTLLPGDIAQAANGEAVIWCPNHSQTNIKSGTVVRLEQEVKTPSLYLLSGTMQTNVEKADVLFRSDSFLLRARGEAEKNILLFKLTADGMGLACVNGIIDSTLVTDGAGDPKKRFVTSQNCRFGIGSPSSAERTYLFHGDSTYQSDLALARKFRMPLNSITLLESFGFPESIKQMPMFTVVKPATAPTGHLSLSWTAPFQLDMNCTLYSQSGENKPPLVVHKFVSPKPEGEIILQRDFRKLWLSLICTKDTTTLVSNLNQPLGL